MEFSDSELDSFNAVYERDIDIALVVALRASAAVRGLFAGAMGSAATNLVNVRNSVPTPDGREADIELVLASHTGSVTIEIENKLDASFQSEQVESYLKRAMDAKSFAILVAPHQYLAASQVSATRFHGTVRYEDVRDTLLADGNWGRSIALLLEHAIRQHRRGGRMSPDSLPRSQFFNAFAELGANSGLPSIPDRPRKAGAGFLWYPRDVGLTQVRGWKLPNGAHGAWLSAKFEHGSADIELTGIRSLVDLAAVRQIALETGMDLEIDKISLRFKTAAPRLNPDEPLERQSVEARHFVQRVLEARAWWESKGRRSIEACLLPSAAR
ncbi:MAG: hypothetical protein JNL28_04690 [Planctomycetes bacterium]|nr:hypothetical protein [Planctomycetota bacterium]